MNGRVADETELAEWLRLLETPGVGREAARFLLEAGARLSLCDLRAERAREAAHALAAAPRVRAEEDLEQALERVWFRRLMQIGWVQSAIFPPPRHWHTTLVSALGGRDPDRAEACFELLLGFARRPGRLALCVFHDPARNRDADCRLRLAGGRLEGP